MSALPDTHRELVWPKAGLYRAAAALLFLVATLSNAETTADRIYHNGKIYTVDAALPWAEAFAIRGDRFMAVGSLEELNSYAGDTTEYVDLEGRFVLPGLIDDHLHPDMVAESFMGISLLPSEMDWQEQTERIREAAERTPSDTWLVGGNLDWLDDGGRPILGTQIPSHHRTLDALVPDKPTMLWDIGGHALLLNSAGMRELGIDASTPNPEGGVVVKDREGKPTGVLRETAANHAYEIALKTLPRGQELVEKGIKPVFSKLNSLGFTSVTDAWTRYYMLEAYRDMCDSGEMSLRVRSYIADPVEWHSDDWKRGAVEAIDNQAAYNRENCLNANGVKFVLDGSAGGQTIIMVEPYEGTADVHGGPWRNDPDYFREKFREYDARGITIKSHGVGSASIRVILDAIEEARKQGSTLRHSVAHAVFIHPADRERFAKLNAVAEFSPYFWHPVPGWAIVREELGDRRIEWAFPFNTLHENGVNISVGSDWPVADNPNPFHSIESMITRRSVGGESKPLPLVSEGISLEVAIRAYTMGGAYAQGWENQIGSITPGKLADFTVLDQNLFDIETYEIHKTNVLETFVGGRAVFSLIGEGPAQ